MVVLNVQCLTRKSKFQILRSTVARLLSPGGTSLCSLADPTSSLTVGCMVLMALI
jgi:hypothetical protein